MRDHVLLYVNGKRYEIRGQSVFSSLSDFLRCELKLTGTKVVCAEGDCGACTVLVGQPMVEGLRYLTVDACIQFLYQLDCRHVITVEGLGTEVAGERTACESMRRLHPVQQAMVDCHGSQCGYCTPGFVMALAGMFEETPERDLRTALTGNLCRCTGYLPILEAASSIDVAKLPSLREHYPSADIARDLLDHANASVLVEVPSARSAVFFAPRTLEEAVKFKARHPDAVIVSGGTELGVLRNKQGLEPRTLLSLMHIPGLADITSVEDAVVVGANVTWTQVESFARVSLPELHRVVVRFGSPQIRNVATLVANVAHGSPIADSLPFLLVMDAELDLVGPNGPRRVPINDFYKGYKVKDLAPEEIITQVRFSRPDPDELLKLYKVSRRQDLDIATFGAAVRIRKAGEIITHAKVAYSGVAPTVVRLRRTEAFLQGKHFAEETFAEAGRMARTEIQPITDVRGTRDFRRRLAENILLKFFFDCAAPANAHSPVAEALS
jgi:xanthine dehydrogenase small subunit